MSGIGLSTWLLLGMVVVGIYVLPSVTAKFAGSHTMEFNASGTGQNNASGMACGQCHTYIEDELNATGTDPNNSTADEVLDAHIDAMETGEYANDDIEANKVGFVQIGNFTAGTVTKSTVCALCHAAEINILGSHTQVVTRVCTDPDCHGFNSSRNYSASSDGPLNITFPGGQNITEKLNLSGDVHSGFYWALEKINSTRATANDSDTAYANQTGLDHTTADGDPAYGQGYLACLACHTHFGMNMNLTRPQTFNINISIDASGDVAIQANNPINESNSSNTFAQKLPVSVW